MFAAGFRVVRQLVNGRLLAALILAPVACSVALGAAFLIGLDRSGSQASTLVLFLPGLMYGALFEIVALLPLVYWLRRRGSLSFGRVLFGGLLLWAAGVALQLWATSEPSIVAWLSVAPMLMVPGIALVLVFAFVVSRERAA